MNQYTPEQIDILNLDHAFESTVDAILKLEPVGRIELEVDTSEGKDTISDVPVILAGSATELVLKLKETVMNQYIELQNEIQRLKDAQESAK